MSRIIGAGFGASVLLLVALSATQVVARSAEPLVILKFSHVVAPDTPKGKAAERFASLVKEKTRGRVSVEVYPNSTLYKDNDELEALQLGAVQMLAPSLAKFAPLGITEFEVFDLPFLFHDQAALRRVEEGPVGTRLFAGLERRGIKGLAFWDNGFKVMSANSPVRTPQDFVGLKMRIQASKVLDAQFRTLGAKPVVLGLSEVYGALKAGLVDGTENPPSNLYTQHMNEVQRYVTVSNHGYLGYAVIVNQMFWNNLPSDIRAQLEDALREATTYANAIAQRENDAALAKVKATGKTEIYVLSEEERATWKRALAPVYVQMQDRIGKDLIDAIRADANVK